MEDQIYYFVLLCPVINLFPVLQRIQYGTRLFIFLNVIMMHTLFLFACIVAKRNRIMQEFHFQVSIILAGVLVGVETNAQSSGEHGVTAALDIVVLLVFTLEVFVKLIAEECHPGLYFKDTWNIFDFGIVFLSLLFLVPGYPQVGMMLAFLRLLRLLRILKLLKALPGLIVVVEAILGGLGSVLFASTIIYIFIYVYANVGIMLFRENDPEHFGEAKFERILTYFVNFIILT